MSGTEKINEFMGEMKTHIVHIREKVDVMGDKVDTLNNQSVEQKIKIDSAHKRIDTLHDKVKGHEELKNKGLGVLTVLSLVIGTIGAGISKLLGHMFQ